MSDPSALKPAHVALLTLSLAACSKCGSSPSTSSDSSITAEASSPSTLDAQALDANAAAPSFGALLSPEGRVFFGKAKGAIAEIFVARKEGEKEVKSYSSIANMIWSSISADAKKWWVRG